MSYRQAKPDEIQRNRRKVNEYSTTQFIISAAGEDIWQRPLVAAHWSGNKLMILRTKPIIISFSQFENEEHSRLYSELLLFRPWKEESSFLRTSPNIDECRARHAQEQDAIIQVKEGLKELILEQRT